MFKNHYLRQPETRSIVWLAICLVMIVGAGLFTSWWASFQNGWLLLGLFILAAALITVASWRWMREITQRLTAIDDQLRAARTGHTDYQMSLNDEGLFSSLHNELYHYVRQTEAMREDLDRDRQQLTVAITDIAHQLRTPIATIDNLTELLAPDNVTTSRAELLQQNQRLAKLVEQLILMAKVDTHTLSQAREQMSVDQLLHQSLNYLLPLIADAELRLDWQIPAAMEISVNVRLMQEAIINILKNTVEHAPTHSTVTISASATPISTVISVTNHGEPIPESDLPHLFERFYRGSQSSQNNLGIGLAIAEGIAKAGDGRLSVNNVAAGVEYRLELFK